MQQACRFLKIDTTQQRQVVRCLQQSKMIFHQCGGCPFHSEPILQLLLELQLASEERVEERKLRRVNRASIRTSGEQVVGVHGSQQSSVRIRFGHYADGTLAYRQVVNEVYLFER